MKYQIWFQIFSVHLEVLSMFNIKLFSIISLFCLLSLSSCYVSKNTIENTDKIKNEIISLLKNENFKLESDIDFFPLSILHYMEKDAGDRIIIANPKDRMRISDGITNENYDLPFRRLLFWKKVEKDYVLAIERGGRAHNIIILHFELRGNPKLISSLSISEKPKHSFSYILELLQNKKVTLLYNRKTKIKKKYYYY